MASNTVFTAFNAMGMPLPPSSRRGLVPSNAVVLDEPRARRAPTDRGRTVDTSSNVYNNVGDRQLTVRTNT